MPLESVVDKLENPTRNDKPERTNSEQKDVEYRFGETTFLEKKIQPLDVIDIVQNSINVGKINNSTKLKILNNVIKELKAFYGN